MINLARGRLTPATVVGESGLEFSQIRISNLAWFYHNHNEVVQSICKQIAEIVEQPIHYADNLQVAHYGVGGKFEPHLDCYDIEQEAYQAFLERSGQRLYTALFYLNDVVSGGETYFPNLNIEVSPTTGTLLIFENCQPGTSIPDQRSLHGSKILQCGEKWIGTLWFCDRPQYQV
ncbi:2OG-Fe(II) oxygenase [Cohnella sp. REN36]|uniref:prolyl hydroxylase family protein n=1 Tax=Cohnella sp. REN36 TaxID=2887347 RepID=UPI001D145205|nr:2OG-Fe(II) oxygenase [Cohnella sp. REN36]MCC3372456.1 2OG-Fe(II) oxygenase [Cohnella sp. REN36]